MSKRPFPSFEEFSRRRARLPADVLANKYVGLFFGVPFLTGAAALMVWIIADDIITRPELYHSVFGAYQTETVRWWRNLTLWAVALNGVFYFVGNAKDPGTGLVVTLGRVAMPIAKLLLVGQWPSALAYRNASISDRELYERFRRSYQERQKIR
ncbi:hypothetical protein FG152_17380 [Ochrobactrum sp. XJ1]|nr:hypothetical protein [Ochrobactrum sp. XJ1]